MVIELVLEVFEVSFLVLLFRSVHVYATLRGSMRRLVFCVLLSYFCQLSHAFHTDILNSAKSAMAFA